MTTWDMNITEKTSPFSEVPSGEENPRAGNYLMLLNIFLLDKNQMLLWRSQHHHSSTTIPTRGMHWESEALSWTMLESKAREIKGKAFFIKHHHLSNTCTGSCCDEACLQFFAELHVFMSLRHMFPGFSVEIKKKKCKSSFCLSPSVIGEFGHRVVHQPC